MMTRVVVVAMAVLAVVAVAAFMVGCSGSSGGVAGYIANLYTPFMVGSTWAYDEDVDGEVINHQVWTAVGTRSVGGVTCLDIRISEAGAPMMHMYGTVTDAGGAVLHATGNADGSTVTPVSPPSPFFTTNPPARFSTRVSSFGLDGDYVGEVVARGQTITVPAGTFTNAIRVTLTGVAPTAHHGTYWTVPNVGVVRAEVNYSGGMNQIFTLQSYHIGP